MYTNVPRTMHFRDITGEKTPKQIRHRERASAEQFRVFLSVSDTIVMTGKSYVDK